jgi:hypothetical protein
MTTALRRAQYRASKQRRTGTLVGRCTGCGQDYAITRDNRVRLHNNQTGQDCPGGGLEPVTTPQRAGELHA